MTCDTFHALMLEADVEALAGHGVSGLATHVRRCPTCAARAASVLRQQAALNRMLEALGPRLSPDDAVGGAVAAATLRRRAKRRWMLPAAAFAAAAILVAMLLTAWPDPPTRPIDTAVAAPPPDPPSRLELQISSERPTVVLATRNPAITVVWFP